MTKDGAKGQVYPAESGRAFLERGRGDRHQFRFIVSAEEGVEQSDLRTTTRDLMQQMEADLGTKLDWIAVDHHNIGHPHTHILLRGLTEDGKTLNIDGDNIRKAVGLAGVLNLLPKPVRRRPVSNVWPRSWGQIAIHDGGWRRSCSRAAVLE